MEYPTEQIAALLNSALDSEAGPSRAPGMLESHYAPRCRLLLVTSPDDARRLARGRPTAEILDDDDLARYARSLYSRLRDADDRGVDTVIAVMPPAVGLGHAIRDRLTKAASTPRDESTEPSAPCPLIF